MRAISSFDATHCEDAEHDKCHCRCGGQLHGKTHAGLIERERDVIAKNGELKDEDITTIVNSEARRLKDVPAKKGPKAKGKTGKKRGRPKKSK